MSLGVIINNIEVAAVEGEWLLEVILRAGFDVPHLCHHPALEPIGACRLCLVELSQRGRTEVTTSCNVRVEPGMRVTTDSAQVRRHRAANLELLLGRAPASARLRELAAAYGIEAPIYPPLAAEGLPNCILCELCVRVCDSLGHRALCAVGRGDKKRIGLPLNQPAESCVGCASCAAACPTGCIPVKDEADTRTIWGQKFKLLRCPECGAPLITEKQREYALRTGSLREDDDVCCESCKQVATAKRFASVVW